jgi:hypothetical protein
MEIIEKLPNSSYSIAIDERGIIVEGQVDPLYKIENISELVYLWDKTDEAIDYYFECGEIYNRE